MVRLRAHLGKTEGQTGTLLRGTTKSSHTRPPNCRKHRGGSSKKVLQTFLDFQSLSDAPCESPQYTEGSLYGVHTAVGRKAICLSRTTIFNCSPNIVSADCTLRLDSPKSLREDNDFWSRYAWLRVQCVTSGYPVLNPFRLRRSRAVREDSACRHRKLMRKPRA